MYFYFFALSTATGPKNVEKTSEVQQTPAGPRAVATLPTSQKSRIRTYQSSWKIASFALPKVLRGRDRYQKTRIEKVEYECDLENPERMSRDLQKWEKPSKSAKSAVFRP